ncbi:hypothetical protein ACRWFE_25100, partial [Escherichia coli]
MPGKFRFSRRSEKNLEGVKPQLVAVVRRALELTEVDFGITEGLRSKYRQKQLVAEGKSQMNRPGFPGECFICELRLPDHRFRWKHNKLFLLL